LEKQKAKILKAEFEGGISDATPGRFTIFDLRLRQDLTPRRKEARSQGGTPSLRDYVFDKCVRRFRRFTPIFLFICDPLRHLRIKNQAWVCEVHNPASLQVTFAPSALLWSYQL
jgi:hypothetical protein